MVFVLADGRLWWMESGLTENKKKKQRKREKEKKKKKEKTVSGSSRTAYIKMFEETNHTHTHTHISLVLRVDRLGSNRFTPSLSQKLAQPSRLRGHFVQTAYCTNGCYLQAYVKC